MPKSISTVLYCKAVEDSLRFVTIDKETGKQADFSKLFYPLGIDEGSLAFQHFLAQVDRTQKAEESIPDIRNIKDKVSKYKKNRAKNQQGEKQSTLTLQESLPTDEIAISRITAAAQDLLKDLKHARRSTMSESNNAAVVQYENTEIEDGIAETEDGITEVETYNDFQNKSKDFLLFEPDAKKRNRIVWTSEGNDYSRVLVLASAGYGKSTLLTRIALFYCSLQHDIRDSEKLEIESEFAAYYKLPYSNRRDWNYIPCLIRLRTVKEENASIEQIIQDSIHSYLPTVAKDDIVRWIGTEQDRLLLLFDGLDELSEDRKRSFLDSLESFLAKKQGSNPIVLSSRVSGLSEQGVNEKLQAMRFHGRTILPLSDNSIISYCKQWINVTQSEDASNIASYLQLVESIQVEEKYKYLRDFMRKPLELTIILKQIVNKALSSNKWEMFYDMLWWQFTSHVPTSQKQGIFDDTMLFLSIISKSLQDRRTMFFEVGFISELIQNLSLLSFQTTDYIELTEQSIIDKLDQLASSIGIVEKDDTHQMISYTFPIRAYQEFLAAYACCHVHVDLSKSRVDPLSALLPHVNDPYWDDVILYSLLDMESNHSYLLDSFKNNLFENCSSPSLLQSIIESKVYIDLSNATTLCRVNFQNGILSEQEFALLDSCLHCDAPYSFNKALLTLYKTNSSINPWSYLDSVSFSLINKVVNRNEQLTIYLHNLLWDAEDYKQYIGAGIISLLSRAALDEAPLVNKTIYNAANENASDVLTRLIATEENLFSQLYSCATRCKSPIFVYALTEVLMTRLGQTAQIIPFLDRNLLAIVYPHVIKEWEKGCSYKKDSCIISLLYIISAFPVSIISAQIPYPFPLSCFIRALHSFSIYDESLNRMALAVIQLTNGKSFDEFMTEWIWSICRGVSSNKVKNTAVSLREQNHFQLLCEQLYPIEGEYRNYSRKQLNNISDIASLIWSNGSNASTSPASRTSKHIIDLAVDYYQRAGYGKKTDKIVEDLYIKLSKGLFDATASTNLAFLLRNGKIKSPIKELSISELIDKLLFPGIQERNSYALMNMALKLIDDGKMSDIDSLLNLMTIEGWNEVVNHWWYPMLWVREHTEEGALVCLMANKYAGIKISDYEEMINILSKRREILPLVTAS